MYLYYVTKIQQKSIYNGDSNLQHVIFIYLDCAEEGELCGPLDMRCCDGLICPVTKWPRHCVKKEQSM